MGSSEEWVEVSYQVMSESLGILTVAFFVNEKLLYIIAGKQEEMKEKLDKLF